MLVIIATSIVPTTLVMTMSVILISSGLDHRKDPSLAKLRRETKPQLQRSRLFSCRARAHIHTYTYIYRHNTYLYVYVYEREREGSGLRLTWLLLLLIAVHCNMMLATWENGS